MILSITNRSYQNFVENIYELYIFMQLEYKIGKSMISQKIYPVMVIDMDKAGRKAGIDNAGKIIDSSKIIKI